MTLIDKEEALTAIANEIRKLHNEDAIVVGEKIEEIGLRTAFDIIKHLPTVESRPKGKWTDRNGRIVYPELERYRCSVCGQDSDRYNYCPNCGADMRGNQDVKR